MNQTFNFPSLIQRTQFAAVACTLVGFELLSFWADIGVRPFIVLLLLYSCVVYSLPFLGVGWLIGMGVFQESIFDYPLGFLSLQYLFLQTILMYQDKTRLLSSILASWFYFGIFLTGACILRLACWSFLIGPPIAWQRFLPDFLLTISLYPLFIGGLSWLYQRLLSNSSKNPS